MGLRLVTAPSADLFGPGELALRLGVANPAADGSDALAKAAATKLERQLARAFLTQTWDFTLDDWPCCGTIVLPVSPATGVVSITYRDAAGVTQTVAGAAYSLVAGDLATIVPAINAVWPVVQFGSIVVRFTAGYGDTFAAVPEPLRTAVVLITSHLRSLQGRNLFISQETIDGVSDRRFVVSDAAFNAVWKAVSSLVESYQVFL